MMQACDATQQSSRNVGSSGILSVVKIEQGNMFSVQMSSVTFVTSVLLLLKVLATDQSTHVLNK